LQHLFIAQPTEITVRIPFLSDARPVKEDLGGAGMMGGVTWRVAVPICLLSLVLPPLIAIALSAGPFSNLVFPEILREIHPSDEAITQLGDLTQLMISMSVGLGLASAWFYRQPLKPSLGHTAAIVLCTSMALAFVSIFAGLRFKFDLAMQLRVIPLDFDRVGNRLYWQGYAMLGQVSMLCLAGALHYLWRDGRFGGERGK
jgi:hypothetical protein